MDKHGTLDGLDGVELDDVISPLHRYSRGQPTFQKSFSRSPSDVARLREQLMAKNIGMATKEESRYSSPAITVTARSSEGPAATRDDSSDSSRLS